MDGALGADDWWEQVHGEHRPQISQAFMLGNAFANPALLADDLFPLTSSNLPPWLATLADRRAVTLQPHVMYVLATDGFWSCPQAQRWMARWPGFVRHCADAHAAVAALFTALETQPPRGMHPDNATAVVVRLVAPESALADETALPERMGDVDHA
jgi:serine/threonine protein phosphatase PrpC